ncbi:NUDIX hydrolase [uncultured Flavonifractor sp.]|uniref:NUDIX hydrolase n=1 Tax=uncultured Flavonifractor sp. TaxID=1193534 RepID=UPI0026224FFE|nr:CoA pyrophosphatase [uncultured Flavonifractor sp.]
MARLEDFRARWAGHVPEIQDITTQYAVLVPLVERPEGLSLLYEVRSDTLGRQPGEVCFPGGRMEAGETPETCALRETWEELGIPQPAVEVVAALDLVTHQGGFVMHPILGIVDPQAPVVPSPAEVKTFFTVPVDWLVKHPPAVYTYDLVPQVGEDFPYERVGFPQGYRWRGGRATVPVYDWPEYPIWGLTGRITRQLLEGMG